MSSQSTGQTADEDQDRVIVSVCRRPRKRKPWTIAIALAPLTILFIAGVVIFEVSRHVYREAENSYLDSNFHEMRMEKKKNPKPRGVQDTKLKNRLANMVKRSKPSVPVGQAQSKFLSLPVEIRIMVYELVIGSKTVFMDWNGMGTRRISGFMQEVECCRPHMKCQYQRGEKVQVTNLMRTCHFVHSELSSVLYNRTFMFQHMPSLIHFTTRLPSHHLSQMSTLHIEADWHEMERPIHLLNIPGHTQAQCIPPLCASTKYSYLTTKPKGRPRWPFGSKNTISSRPVPSLWGAICEDLCRMTSLRKLTVIMRSRLTRDGVDEHSSAEHSNFLLEPLVMVKRASGNGSRRVELVVDWELHTDIGDLHGVIVTKLPKNAHRGNSYKKRIAKVL